MKNLRNLFVLFGDEQQINKVKSKLHFKGIVITENSATSKDFDNIFDNNKSVVSSYRNGNLTFYSENSVILIEVVDDDEKRQLTDFINITDEDTIAQQFAKIAEKYNCDIGDHKSNSSGINGSPSISDCSYCQTLVGSDSVIPTKILYSTENFFVMVTSGEFIKGYLLIIPIEHIMSMTSLSAAKRLELMQVINDVSYLLKLTYNFPNLLIWENGTGAGGLGKAKDSVVHAHMHIAPSNLTIDSIKTQSKVSFEKINVEFFPGYTQNSYLLIRGDNNKAWYINDNPNIYFPRQYIRQILAEEHGLIDEDIWNWRTHPFLDKILETENDILSAISNNWNKIPKEIQENIKNTRKKFLY